MKLSNGWWAIAGDGESDDDGRNSGLTASSCHPAAEADCKRAGSWRTSRCRNPCLRPCLLLLQDSGEVVVTGREELNRVAEGIFCSFSCSSQGAARGENR
jgi:hypothetical protein